jgi:hypothetical protein
MTTPMTAPRLAAAGIIDYAREKLFCGGSRYTGAAEAPALEEGEQRMRDGGPTHGNRRQTV